MEEGTLSETILCLMAIRLSLMKRLQLYSGTVFKTVCDIDCFKTKELSFGLNDDPAG